MEEKGGLEGAAGGKKYLKRLPGNGKLAKGLELGRTKGQSKKGKWSGDKGKFRKRRKDQTKKKPQRHRRLGSESSERRQKNRE